MRGSIRLVLLRTASLAGLLASATLTADALHPDRKFCPLEAACAAARASPLGSILGVPTSTIGLVAFTALLALTLVPSPRARGALVPASVLAAFCGAGLLAYQAMALDGFCPLCLVADVAGLAAGAAVLGGSSRMGEGAAEAAGLGAPPAAKTRVAPWVAWSVAGAIVVAAPILWPRGAGRPAWVPLALGSSPAPGAEAAPAGILLIEYLNPFCVHCRATHTRLADVLRSLSVPVERYRRYVWTSKEPPLWAKACVCAQDQGRERPFFAELLHASDETEGEIRAAAARAGLDVQALFTCVGRGDATVRLGFVRKLVLEAHLDGLPTLDIGRRRLQGEQTDEELREAVAAAVADLGADHPR